MATDQAILDQLRTLQLTFATNGVKELTIDGVKHVFFSMDEIRRMITEYESKVAQTTSVSNRRTFAKFRGPR